MSEFHPLCILRSLLTSLSADFAGISEAPEARLAETLKQTQEQLRESLKINSVGPNAMTLKVNILLAEAALNILIKCNRLKHAVDEMDDLFSQKLSAQGKKAEDHAMILKWQNEAVRSLTLQTKVLEESALGVR